MSAFFKIAHLRLTRPSSYAIVEFILMSSPLLDKTLIPLIIGPLVGLLVMSGKITPACTSDVTQAYTIAAGSVIFIGSLLIGAFHHTAIQQTKTTTSGGITTVETNATTITPATTPAV